MSIKQYTLVCILVLMLNSLATAATPHIVLVMADDMGWGQTSYNGHPILKTPNLDAMAAAGLRLDRFYAGAPNCSPTRATVLTGRSNDRGGVLNYGYALRPQERTLPAALRKAGYVTGHFGKWHLNGYSGAGVAIPQEDPRSPGKFGFDEFVSMTNFFDRDPSMIRQGKLEKLQGDSSEIAVNEAVGFLKKHLDGGKPMFAVVWFGSPHSPFVSLPEDRKAFESLDAKSANHYGELVVMDRSIGKLRNALREMKIADNTLLVFCSDNGGLPEIKPDTVGGLRGHKNTLFEGGLRVPGIIEWPAVIKQPRATNFTAGTVDLFPTIADIVGLPEEAMLKPIDGISLKPLLMGDVKRREQPLMFRHQGRAAMIDHPYKLISPNFKSGKFELYNLETDPKETKDLAGAQPEQYEQMKKHMESWLTSVQRSFEGGDYPQGKVEPADIHSLRTNQSELYRSRSDGNTSGKKQE